MPGIEHRHVTLPRRGVTLHVAQTGPADAPLVLFLHGFPDGWHGWT